MTIWSPQTCSCVIEIDDKNNWVKTINKCDLHREFTGKTLLEEVSKHNREYSHRGEPETIEGVLGVDLEADWVAQVRKYPSNEKLEETKFNPDLMKKYHPTDKEFQYCLSNFLNSSTSVLWYLLEEYKYPSDREAFPNDDAHPPLVISDLLMSRNFNFILNKQTLLYFFSIIVSNF